MATTRLQDIEQIAKTQPDQMNAAIADELMSHVTDDDEERFRAFDTILGIATVSPQMLQWTHQSQLLPLVVGSFVTDDILLQMNVIQLLGKLAETAHGVQYLADSGALATLSSLITEQGTFEVLVAHGLRIVLSMSLKREYSVPFVQKFGLLDGVAQRLSDSSHQILDAAACAFAAIASTAAGLRAAVAKPDAVGLFSELLTSHSPNLRVSAFHSLSRIVEPVYEPGSEDQLRQKQLFDQIPVRTSLVEFAVKLMDKPLQEQKVAVYDFFQALAQTQWGVSALFAFTGFLQWLTDRKNELTHAGRQWKYAVVEASLRHPNIDALIGSYAHKELLVYQKDGPFYVEAEAGAAVASKSGQ
eukprot:TRINITY_DN88_c0_g1_i1.p1 TRINITY_DN88_c0_g1~~TRINITY_DN88_c0_g1_i1.p1  ORF type:complete len:380 (-),score=85.21 TRINITY_DN88_c0_g1_i1:26-1099(-)